MINETTQKFTSVRPVKQRAVWQRLLASHSHSHLLQSWSWGELKSRYGWQVERVALYAGENPVAGTQILFRPVMNLFTVAYVPKGPVVDWDDPEQVHLLVNGMHQTCRRRRCAFLKLEPALAAGDDRANQLADLSFRPSPFTVQPPRTILVDLTPPEDEILARMKQKTRYNIRLAQRKGVTVRRGTAKDMDTFYHLMQLTGERDAFGIHSQAYYESAFELFKPEERALLVAEVEGTAVADLMVFVHPPTAYYLFGASSDSHRNLMPTYLLQWEALRWAKRHNCLTYDMWGVPDVEEDTMEAQFSERGSTGSGLWGVYRFKRGFGGHVIRDAGAFDAVYNRPLYWAYEQLMAHRRGEGGL
jgi:peptidoglycan pentaglycine glycine transferase (the first glycine)